MAAILNSSKVGSDTERGTGAPSLKQPVLTC